MLLQTFIFVYELQDVELQLFIIIKAKWDKTAQKAYFTSYISSIFKVSSGDTCYQTHFQKAVLPKVKEKKLHKEFFSVVSRYVQTELTKTTFVANNLENVFEALVEHVDSYMAKYGREARIRRGEPDTFGLESFPDLIRIVYGDFIHLSVLLSQMFFALEFSCRMLCVSDDYVQCVGRKGIRAQWWLPVRAHDG